VLIYKGVFVLPTSGSTARVPLVPDNLPIPANVSVTPTADTATFIASPWLDSFLCTAGSPTNIPGSGGKPISITGFSIQGTPGDTVSVAIYYPEQIEAPLVNVDVTGTVGISGTVDTNLTEISGVAQHGADIVTPIQAIGGTVQTIGGTPMLAMSAQDPPQVTVTAGKAIPVKTET
jgi:hypothetical protein